LDLIFRFLGGTGIGVACGINPYLPLLVISAAAKSKLVTLNSEFQFMGEWVVLIILAVLVGIEIIADKLPQIENLYRATNLVASPIAGGIAFAATVPGNLIPPVFGFFIGLIIAELTHLVKSGLRPQLIRANKYALTFESFISMGEDMLVAALAILALAIPVVSGLLGLVLLVGAYMWMQNLKRRAPVKI
jgi:hypothetical protein